MKCTQNVEILIRHTSNDDDDMMIMKYTLVSSPTFQYEPPNIHHRLFSQISSVRTKISQN